MGILVNDIVKVIAGDDTNSVGKVISVDREKSLVIVEGVNIKKRHKKADREGKGGGIIDFPAPIHVSNVKLENRPDRQKTKIKKSKSE